MRGPTFILEDAVRAGRPELLLTEFPTPELGIYAVFPSNCYVPHRVRVPADDLVKRLGHAPGMGYHFA